MNSESNKYTILFCYRNTMNPQRGGVQKVSDILAKYFIAKGHKVSYLIYEKEEKDTYSYPAEIHYLPNTDFFSEENKLFYHKLLEDLSIDIIINHDASNDRSELFLNTGNHPAKKISLHHNDPLIRLNDISTVKGKTRFIPNFLLQFYKLHQTQKEINYLLENSDSLVLLSNSFIDKIKIQTRIVSNKITSISNPLVIAQNIERTQKKKQILFVGRIELKQKRPDIMLQIWSKIQPQFKEWELLFLGDGPDRRLIEEVAAAMELKNIKFEGYVDPEPYYNQASLICMTSDYEGFGMVLIEAMQFGVVPIAFDNWASLKDIIEDNKTGFIIPSNEISCYVKKLSLLIENDDLRGRQSENAISKSKQFDINTVGEKWQNLFDNLQLQ